MLSGTVRALLTVAGRSVDNLEVTGESGGERVAAAMMMSQKIT